jgi:hypothetical protein
MKALAHLRYLLAENPLTLAAVLALLLLVGAVLGPSLAPFSGNVSNMLLAFSYQHAEFRAIHK